MVKIETEISRGGFHFKQLVRKGRFAIYAKTMQNLERSPAGFEVVVIQKREATEMFGISYPPRELYPSSGDWGTNGFTFLFHRDAIRKFDSLVLLADGRRQRGPSN